MSRAKDLFQKLKIEGEKAIDDLIQLRQSENLFLDFKRVSDDGNKSRLNDNDRNHLAKAISGFGNSEGGVLIWGVDCSRKRDGSDLPDFKRPIQDVKRFTSQLEGIVSGLTLPPHNKVENFSIVSSGKQGFVATYIPQYQSTPLQTVYNKRFYVRVGSNFEVMPYQVLAGMFGRRPQPNVYVMYTLSPAKLMGNKIKVQVGFLLHNEGPGIAKDIFLNVQLMSSPGENCQISFETPDRHNWVGNFVFQRFMNLISKNDIRLAPDAQLQPLVLSIVFEPPFNKDLHFNVSCGCSNAPTLKSSIRTTKQEIEAVFDKYIYGNHRWENDVVGHKIAKQLLSKTQ